MLNSLCFVLFADLIKCHNDLALGRSLAGTKLTKKIGLARILNDRDWGSCKPCVNQKFGMLNSNLIYRRQRNLENK